MYGFTMPHRRRSAAAAAACFALALTSLGTAPAPSAGAGRVVTWKTQSRHVDARRVEFGRPPLCGKCTPHPSDGLYVNVWLPDGYDGKRRFPVLYLLHGGDGQYDFWVQSPRENDPRGTIVPDLVGDFPAIIVMPDAGANGHYMNWWNGGRRGDPGWERYHLDELIPLVERRLKVRRGRRFHAIAGFSLGGYGAAFYASQRPGYFGIAAALSARLSLRNPLLHIPATLCGSASTGRGTIHSRWSATCAGPECTSAPETAGRCPASRLARPMRSARTICGVSQSGSSGRPAARTSP
jgi:S-formylglutathione hydrolase FrmB